MKPNTALRKAMVATAVAAIFCAPSLASAESTFTTGGSPTATAHIDFQIVVPKILYLRVGSGTSMASNTTVDQIQFTVPAANLGDGSVIAGTGGDLSGGVVTARLIGNNGTIAFSSTTSGALGNGAGDTISFGQIAASVSTLTSATALPHPALADGATTSLSISPTVGKTVNEDARWTYTYLNQVAAAPGTYGGVNVNSSRVTYSASMP